MVLLCRPFFLLTDLSYPVMNSMDIPSRDATILKTDSCTKRDDENERTVLTYFPKVNIYYRQCSSPDCHREIALAAVWRVGFGEPFRPYWRNFNYFCFTDVDGVPHDLKMCVLKVSQKRVDGVEQSNYEEHGTAKDVTNKVPHVPPCCRRVFQSKIYCVN